MNLSRFTRKSLPIIIENRLFFRPKNGWFTAWNIVTSSLLISVLFLITITYFINFIPPTTPKVLGVFNVSKTYEEIAFWQQKINQFPNYRDAYLELAILNWKIRNDDQAKIYLEKAKEIDPNNETVKKLENLFE